MPAELFHSSSVTFQAPENSSLPKLVPTLANKGSSRKNQSVFDLNAQSFLYQERAKRVFETELKTQEKFLHTKYNSYYNPARKLKDEINSRLK